MALLLEIVKVILKMLTLIKPGIAMGIAEEHIKVVTQMLQILLKMRRFQKLFINTLRSNFNKVC